MMALLLSVCPALIAMLRRLSPRLSQSLRASARLLVFVSSLHLMFASSPGYSQAPAKPSTSNTIVIAVAGPLTGIGAQGTAAMKAAVQDVANTVNGGGGLVGKSINVITADDGCQREKAEDVARRLVADGAALVIGHPCTRASLAAGDIYAASNTLFMATNTRHPHLTRIRKDGMVLRLAGRDDRQADMIAADILKRYASKPTAIAIVHDRTQYARTLADGVINKLKIKDAPANVKQPTVITATIIAGDKDYTRLIAKIKDAGVVVFAGFPIEAGLIYTQLRAAGSAAEVIGSDSIPTAEFGATFSVGGTGFRAVVPTSSDLVITDPRENGPRESVGQTNRTHPAADQPSGGSGEAGGNEQPDMSTDAAVARAGSLAFVAAVRAAQSVARDQVLSQLIDTPPATVKSEAQHTTTPTGLRFSANGDAHVASYRLIEFNGTGWRAVD